MITGNRILNFVVRLWNCFVAVLAVIGIFQSIQLPHALPEYPNLFGPGFEFDLMAFAMLFYLIVHLVVRCTLWRFGVRATWSDWIALITGGSCIVTYLTCTVIYTVRIDDQQAQIRATVIALIEQVDLFHREKGRYPDSTDQVPMAHRLESSLPRNCKFRYGRTSAGATCTYQDFQQEWTYVFETRTWKTLL